MAPTGEDSSGLFGLDAHRFREIAGDDGQDVPPSSQAISASYSQPSTSQTYYASDSIPGWDTEGFDPRPYANYWNDLDTGLPWTGSDLTQPSVSTPQQQPAPRTADSSQSRSDAGQRVETTQGWDLNGGSSARAAANLPNSSTVSQEGYGLSAAQHAELLKTAMPSHVNYTSPSTSSTGMSSQRVGKSSTSLSPDASNSAHKSSLKKRKASEDVEDDEDEEDEDGRPVKKTAHNEIEKRYRNNINDKINELRDSVPSLRIMYKSSRGEDTTQDREQLHGLTPAHKLNKGTVLSKATEYIRHLKKRNDRLVDENETMRARLAAFEKLYMAGAVNGPAQMVGDESSIQPTGPYRQQQFDSPQQAAGPDRHDSPAGMIEVPNDMRRIISASTAYGQTYHVPQQQYRGGFSTQVQQRQQQPQPQNRYGINYGAKLMVGSLAGILILQSTRENEKSNENPDGRGLFALPAELLQYFASSLDLTVMGVHVHQSLKILLLLGLFLWIWVPTVFYPPPPKHKKVDMMALQPAPSLASSIQVRRQAWLTSIQTVWVPRHNFVLEALALMLKIVKITVRNAIGIRGFQMLTGLTEEQEQARVKAWRIALDSLLTGGDVEVNKSRLVLTLLASYTLPETPARLMLQALHFRVLFWNLGPGRYISMALNALSLKIARSLWNEARQLNQLLAQLHRKTSIEQENELPEHLAVLVEQECDVVLSSDVIQRAHNLAFNLDTTHEVLIPIDGMDAVVEDSAIGSPLDAVAAWWSTELLHRVLTGSLQRNEYALTSRAEEIRLSQLVAPIGSVAQVRAAVAKAVLVEQNRGANLAAALQAVNPKETQILPNSPLTAFQPVSSAQNPDLVYALRCAIILAHLRKAEDNGSLPLKAGRLIDAVSHPKNLRNLSLLAFTAAMELLESLFDRRKTLEFLAPSTEKLAGGLRCWMGGAPGDDCGLAADVQLGVVRRCITIIKILAGMDLDQGYDSLSDEDFTEEPEAVLVPTKQ